MADTRQRFVEAYPYPIPSIWSVAINELLVNQHFVRYNSKYEYSKLASLGFVSVFDQLTEVRGGGGAHTSCDPKP